MLLDGFVTSSMDIKLSDMTTNMEYRFHLEAGMEVKHHFK
jgi:hypothetical protein